MAPTNLRQGERLALRFNAEIKSLQGTEKVHASAVYEAAALLLVHGAQTHGHSLDDVLGFVQTMWKERVG